MGDQYIHITEPRTWVSSARSGHDGIRPAGRDGRRSVCPNHLVINIAGDGSIQMNSQEMATCKINDIPVKVVILNNGYLGMVRQWQELFYGERYSSSVLDQDCPDFVKLADAYGWLGLRLRVRPSSTTRLRAFEYDGPALVDVRVARLEMVYPMVAPGGSIDEMLGVPAGRCRRTTRSSRRCGSR